MSIEEEQLGIVFIKSQHGKGNKTGGKFAIRDGDERRRQRGWGFKQTTVKINRKTSQSVQHMWTQKSKIVLFSFLFHSPSRRPTFFPSSQPTSQPTVTPTANPTNPTSSPTTSPTFDVNNKPKLIDHWKSPNFTYPCHPTHLHSTPNSKYIYIYIKEIHS